MIPRFINNAIPYHMPSPPTITKLVAYVCVGDSATSLSIGRNRAGARTYYGVESSRLRPVKRHGMYAAAEPSAELPAPPPVRPVNVGALNEAT